MRDYDAVIIGGGIGGLVCGGLLARRGIKVAILEKNRHPGGYVSGFNRAGYYFDAGPQAVSFYNILPAVLAELGISEAAVFADSAYRIVGPVFDVTLTSVEDICEVFRQAFPDQAPQLKRFFGRVGGLVAGLQGLMEHPHPFVVNGAQRAATVAGLAGHLPLLTELARLRKVYARDYVRHFLGESETGTFLGEFGWYKGASAMTWLMMLYSFINDYHYPIGGMRSFADLLAGVFREAGGHLNCDTEVTGIIVRSDSAVGVQAGKRQITAKVIIYNGDLKRLVQKLLHGPQDTVLLSEGWRDRILQAPVSETNFSVFVATDFRWNEIARVMGCNHLIYSPGWKNPDPCDPAYFSRVPVEITHHPPVGTGCVSAGVGLVLQCAAPYHWQKNWAHYQGEEYQRIKAKGAEDIIRLAGRAIPGLEERIVFYEAATPCTNEHYTLSYHGATGGFTWDWRKNPTKSMSGHYRTPVKNLYMVGQWTFLPGGVPAAVLSGKRVADLITGAGGIKHSERE